MGDQRSRGRADLDVDADSTALERLAEAYREGTRRPGGVECLERRLVIRLARDEVSPPERDRATEHLGRCADCADAWRVARPLAAVFPTTPARRPRASGPWRVPRLAAAALLATAVVGTGLLVRGVPAPSPDVVRDALPSPIAPAEPADGATLAGPPRRLALLAPSDLPSRQSIEIVLLDATATPLWTSPPLATPDVQLPPDLELAAGAYLWRARSTSALHPWQSALYRFRIEPVP